VARTHRKTIPASKVKSGSAGTPRLFKRRGPRIFIAGVVGFVALDLASGIQRSLQAPRQLVSGRYECSDPGDPNGPSVQVTAKDTRVGLPGFYIYRTVDYEGWGSVPPPFEVQRSLAEQIKTGRLTSVTLRGVQLSCRRLR